MRSNESRDLNFAANLKWLFSDLPLDARFAAAADHGFRGVEYPTPYERSVSEFASLLSASDLKLVLINTPAYGSAEKLVTGIACDPARRVEYRSDVERGLEYATGLGVDLLHVVGGPVPHGVSNDRAWNEYVLNIAWAAEMANGTGVTLLIEPQNEFDSPGFVLRTQSQAVALLEAIGSERVKLLFDVFHVQMQEGNVTTKLLECAPHIGHVQIADSPNRTEPGVGELAWGHLFRQLAGIGYRGWIGCEYHPTTVQGSSIEWLRKVGASQC
jgi:hydroxypyruvate isomerase